MIMEPAMVTVRGRSSVPGEPDEVRLLFWVSFRADSTEAAMREVTDRGATLEAILAELRIPRSGWSTSGMSVREEPEHDERGRVVRTGLRADARFLVRLADASLIGRLL